MDLSQLSALELSTRIKQRQVSCREVMTAHLARIEAHNPGHNAIVNLRPARELLDEADACDAELGRGHHRGWMHGLPQAIKDLSLARGLPATQGSKLFEHFIPDRDSLHVERVKAAGAIVIGKTNTPEFGLGSNTYNDVFGKTGNAFDPRLSAGGSSGGAAVAVALGMLPVADGSDLMGSLRNPAAFNGVIGMRPSAGRVPGHPVPELFVQTLGTGGPMGRTVADVARLLATQSGYHIAAPTSLPGDGSEFAGDLAADQRGVRIGWLGDLGGHLAFEPGVLELCRSAAQRASQLGCRVEDARIDFDMDRLWRAWVTLRQWLVSNRMKDLYRDPLKRTHIKPEVIWEIENGLALSATQVFDASLARSDWYRTMCGVFERFDVLILPSAQVFPYDINVNWPAQIAGKAMDTYHRWMEVVIGASIIGLPAIAMPAGLNAAGLPAGIQIIGPPRADLAVLKFAHAFEGVSADLRRRPTATSPGVTP
jgi:amidase